MLDLLDRSGGVRIAANVKIITTTYLLVFLDTNLPPILASKFNKIGIENLYQANINLIIKDKYSLTLASNCVGKFEFDQYFKR